MAKLTITTDIDVKLRIAGDSFDERISVELDVGELLADTDLTEILDYLDDKESIADYLGEEFCKTHFGLTKED